MSFQKKLVEVQQALLDQGLAGWLIYEYRRSNSLAHSFLEIPSETMFTRRFFYWIPFRSEPIKIVPMIEQNNLDHLPGFKKVYLSWQDLNSILSSILTKQSPVAMEYSPNNALPVISKVDAGTIDLIRSFGVEVVSSANLLQEYTSLWTEAQLQTHIQAAEALEKIVDATWNFIGYSIKNKSNVTEYQVQQFMLNEITKMGLMTQELPICAVNDHSANPHYVPQVDSLIIQPGDFILLDLWGKQKIPHAVYADITRVGVVAKRPSDRQQQIFDIVKKARDKVTQFIAENYAKGQFLEGWEVDQFCREFIIEAGYGNFFIHRTGHNIGMELHGPGANVDNLETHDIRQLLPGTCFSIEPGIYLPNEFGVRLEYDVYIDFSGKVLVTGGVQEQITVVNIN